MAGLRSLAGRDLRERLALDVADRPVPGVPSGLVGEDDLASLPDVVQRYFRFMGVVGRPRTASLRLHGRGRFRMRPGQRFMPCESWQHNTAAPISRIYWMRLDLAGFVPMVGRDAYRDGHGRMLGKLLDRLTVAEGQGEEFDIGELTTWLNDAVMFAPAMLLVAGARFTTVDQTGFDVSVTDSGRTVTARVFLDERGAPVDFRSRDRFADLPSGLVRAEWSTPIGGWTPANGRAFPSHGSAVWHLDEGDLIYAEIEFGPGDVVLDPAPDRPRPAGGRSLVEGVAGALQIAATLVAAPLLRETYNRWGATDAERCAAMPGDELVPSPKLESTRAIGIDAPPAHVWPWLIQIGQGRAGLYSFDALENLVGCDIHSSNTILPAHQHLAVGDLIRLGKPGYPCFRVAALDPGASVVLVAADPVTTEAVPAPVTTATGATWQWTLEAADGGTRTRLVSRQRITYPTSQTVAWHLIEPIGFVMERRMLLGLKRRAEGYPGIR